MARTDTKRRASGRRAQLREEFAFEFLSFARFLGAISAGAELKVHEALTAAVAKGSDSTACVFSISSGLLSGDLDPALSCCAEKIARLRDAGLERLLLWMGPGGVPHDLLVRSMRLFAERVMPRFR